MRQIFRDDGDERLFNENGYVVVDLLDEEVVASLWAFYEATFPGKRDVVDYARDLPYYISVFDRDADHKREVDARISVRVEPRVRDLLIDYDVFYSNYMIKFPGDGSIEAHQDFNFVDESQHTAFNLWCPLVDTTLRNGGLCVIPGSHLAFRTQRGPNLPKALTEYHETLRRYARWLPVRKGQCVIFDHRLIHYSPPNLTDQVRVAIQSVLTPRDAPTVHYVFDARSGRVKAYQIDKAFVLGANLWETRLDDRTVDHEQALIPFPSPAEVTDRLVGLALQTGKRASATRGMLRTSAAERALDEYGFVTLSVLDPVEVQELVALFVESTGGVVENTPYGMYIGLEEPDLRRKHDLIGRLSRVILPKLERHFADCKPHLGSFLVKAPDPHGYTYPHQDWTFVESPRYRSTTVWIALVDTDERNGALGFVRGSHRFFDKPIGSPSPDFRTCSQGHEAALYEYLEFVPLRAGEAVVFDNRTIHGAPPNVTDAPRIAVAIGMTPREAPLRHYFLLPGSVNGPRRTIATLAVGPEFFERHTVASLKATFDAGEMPGDCVVEDTCDDDLLPFSEGEIRQFCEGSGLSRNGRRLAARSGAGPAAEGRGLATALRRTWRSAIHALRS